MSQERLFDDWPDKYDEWFTTPIGKLVKEFETDIILSFLNPEKGQKILDAGCGTGLFTVEILKKQAKVVGLELSLPMLLRAGERATGAHFNRIQGDMLQLPFIDECFDKTVSITAIEFIKDVEGAVRELFRVTRRGGTVIVATLNSLSPWAITRRQTAESDPNSIFRDVIFRTPEQLKALMPFKGKIKTAIHFQKEAEPETAKKIELQSREKGLETGAFLSICWKKP